jgi:hypothetical protein
MKTGMTPGTMMTTTENLSRAEQSKARLASLALLPQGWYDNINGNEIHPHAIDMMSRFVDANNGEKILDTMLIYPVDTGGLSVEWHLFRARDLDMPVSKVTLDIIEVEVEISQDEPDALHVSVWLIHRFPDRPTEAKESAKLTVSFKDLDAGVTELTKHLVSVHAW